MTGGPETAVVGRDAELAALARLRGEAGAGAPAVLVVDGEAGAGKSTLLAAAAAQARADGWDVLATRGVEADAALAYAALAGWSQPLHAHLGSLPPAQRAALEGALGTGAGGGGDRFLVGAALLTALAAAAEEAPRLVVVDDAQWVDRESLEALLFAARRLTRDRVAVVVARRRDASVSAGVDDLPVLPLDGVDLEAARRMLGDRAAPAVVGRLHAATGGNPLALTECARALSPAQLTGAASLPEVLPVGRRLVEAYAARASGLDAGARRALLLAAACADDDAVPVLAALTREGLRPDECVTATGGLLVEEGGRLVFRHPLVRTAVWGAAPYADRRSAHRALAAVLPRGPARTWALAGSVGGYDDDVAGELAALAESERARRGFAAACDAGTRAARLTPDVERAAQWLSLAADDAVDAGDDERARALARDVLARSEAPEPRARALAALGRVEETQGTTVGARDLLAQAAASARGRLLTRTLVELAHLSYVIGDVDAIAAAAERVDLEADRADPEQAMHRDYLVGMAAVLTTGPAAAAEPLGRALAALEGEPTLRDDPRHTLVALLVARWALDPAVAVPFAERRLAQARARGALGVLAPTLSMLAGGYAMLGDHRRAYALAGEAVALLDTLGYRTETGVAHEMLAVECAARGRHDAAAAALDRARASVETAGFDRHVPHLARAVAFCAMCREDWPAVVDVLEDQVRRNGGVGAFLEPLGVTPDLVDAYLALGRSADAREAALAYAAANTDPPRLVAGVVHRCLGQTAATPAEARAELARAVELDGDPVTFDAARTRLAFGRYLRRAGARVESRTHLRAAARAFEEMDLVLWADRAAGELAASGDRRTPRSALGTALTAQETNVALLVAEGMTNAEVAAALFLSPRTVEHHLGAVLRKKGLRSRTQLAASLARG